MNIIEAVSKADQGEKVRRVCWPEGMHLYRACGVGLNQLFETREGGTTNIFVPIIAEYFADDWEVVR